MTATATAAPAPTYSRLGHLISLRATPPEVLRSLLRRAAAYAPVANHPETDTGELAGRSVAIMMFEPSTRTRVSFELAAKRLGASVIHMSAAATSMEKGETLADTARTIEAMGVSAMVVRTSTIGDPGVIARNVACPVINAGDGSHEHPTQGLLDIMCLAEAHRRDDFNLAGLRVAIVGDIINSRVARSAIAGMGALGAEVICIGPPNLAPESLEDLGCRITHDLDSEIPSADAIMMLRVQFERHERTGMIESLESYRGGYALTPEREAMMKPGAIVMHPGPMNRGVEIDSEVADSSRSVVLQQVARGVAVRMSVLATLCE